MNFLKSGWNSVVGTSEPANLPSPAETIEKLIERVETSTLLEDRRDACRALKSLAKTYRLEVGAQGMDALINVLLTDTHDNEIISYTLDALCYIITGPQEDPNDYEGIQSPKEDTEDIGIQFTEIFAKKKENVAILIDLLSEFDFKVRWPALKLLTGLLRNKLRYIQDLVLEKASGIPKIMDLLQDSREIIRNDAILLLVHLTRSNPNIQKIVTFENAFDKFFEIIANEGYTDGGVVVEDCLIVCQYLLKNNTSNQIFFREGNYLLKLLPFLDINDYINWCPQKETNVLFLLYLIRTLVSPTNPANIIAPVQKTILQCGLFSKLCEMLLIKGIPEIVLSETINTVGESIRGDNFNQKFFYNINTLVDPPKPILVVLLMSMINEKQSFILRCAILYCFQCFLFKNEFGQAQIIQTLLPSTIEATEDVNIGQLLCGGLFSQDSISQWFVTVALSHLLIDNKAQKEQLLRVQIATDINSTPIPLFTNCCTLLQESTKFHSKLGLLILLCTWLSNCTFAVIRFLEINTNVPFLISQITLSDEVDDCDMLIHGMCAFLLGICIKYNDDSVQNFTKEDMIQLLNKRIGIDAFIDKINKISNHETYSATLQKPLIKFKSIDDVILDHEFCKLFKSIENDIVRLVKMKPGDQSNPESSLTDEQHKLLVQYKNLIRDQDLQITHLRKELIDLLEKYKSIQNELHEIKSNRDQLKDELALIKQTNNLMISLTPSNDNYSISNPSSNFSQSK